MPFCAISELPARNGRLAALDYPALVCLAGVAVIAADIRRHGWLCRADERAMTALGRIRRPAQVTRAAIAFSVLGDYSVSGALATLLPLLDGDENPACTGGGALLRLVSGGLVRQAAAGALARPRPPACLWLSEPRGYSFPSRHTTLAALAIGAGTAAGRPGTRRAAAITAAAVGASRVYLGVHWPSDVIAGWLLAAAWLRLTRKGPAHAEF